MSEMLTITIDGVECTCEKGEYIFVHFYSDFCFCIIDKGESVV